MLPAVRNPKPPGGAAPIPVYPKSYCKIRFFPVFYGGPAAKIPARFGGYFFPLSEKGRNTTR